MPDFQMHQHGPPPARRASPYGETMASGAPAMKPDIDPPPKPWPFLPAVAVLVVLAFVSLQFLLPVTHVRHPADPHRNWIPVEELRNRVSEDKHINKPRANEGKGALIVTAANGRDLRAVSVVLNSTFANSRQPKELYFCVVVPSALSDSEIQNLKAIFSGLNLEVIRDAFILENIKHLIATESAKDQALELLPFYLPNLFPSFKRLIYLESDSVMQGSVDDLFELDMQGFGIAAVEDCSQIFETFFSFGILDSLRLSNRPGKPWMPSQPYESKTCLFDRGVLVFDHKNWKDNNITEAVHWWQRFEDSLFSSGFPDLPVHLALYQKYRKLDALWSVREPLTFEKSSTAKLLHFDKQRKPWHHAKSAGLKRDVMALWWNYLSPSANEMLGRM